MFSKKSKLGLFKPVLDYIQRDTLRFEDIKYKFKSAVLKVIANNRKVR